MDLKAVCKCVLMSSNAQMPSRYTDYTELASYFPTCASVANFLAQPRGGSKSGLRLSLYIRARSYAFNAHTP
ncbi:hypothetical protein ABBQ32_005203 [Trebouxia sp. C0010 RCD-2024]